MRVTKKKNKAGGVNILIFLTYTRELFLLAYLDVLEVLLSNKIIESGDLAYPRTISARRYPRILECIQSQISRLTVR